MQYLVVILVAAATFGVCFLIDKGFTRLFRSQAEHKSGMAVRLNKKFGVAGILMIVLGLAALFAGLSDGALMLVCGCILLVVGVGLVVYYMTFGIFYDTDSFILTTFGKKSTTYRYRDIKAQQLYVITGGSHVVELHMNDGRAVSIQTTMTGAYAFLDHAFAAWCRQTGRDPESCEFHDPSNSLWFPKVED